MAAEGSNSFRDDWWVSAHERFVAEAKDKEPELLFFGDGLVGWLGQTAVYRDLFAPYHSLCFGLVGDAAPQLLWRLEHGELQSIKPKVIVLSVGSEDASDSASSLSSSIVSVAEAVAAKQPQAHLFVLHLLPRGRRPNPRRDLHAKVNEGLAKALQNIPNTTALDIDPGLVAADGTMDAHDAWDFVHLTQEGYRKAFENLHLSIAALLQPDL